MKTTELLSVLPIKTIHGNLPSTITNLAVDSRAVQADGMFVCIVGFTVDGHNYIDKAIENGATVIITSQQVDVDTEKVAVVQVADTARAISLLAPKYYAYPSKKMTMIGVTGTNGKTSVSGIIHNILKAAGEKAALSGTIGFELDGVLYDTENTTGDVLTTQSLISQAVKEGCTTMTMEVSSHGLVEGRLAGTDYDIAIFTNLTHDHLDFHGTMERYGEAKSLLLSHLGQDLERQKFAIVNADDAWSEILAEKTSYPIFTFSTQKEATFQGTNIKLTATKTHFTLLSPEGVFEVDMNLIGEFSVSNALAAIAALYAKGMPLVEILQHLRSIDAVKGRMELVETDLPITMYVDYAHTPDAIEKAIEAVLPYKQNKLIFLIGTGGNRDRVKRPIMGEKASVAEYVIFTTDDPRYEAYDTIVSELSAGMTHKNFACIGDRKEAVRHAVAVAEENDIIIFAGKGHEDFQIIENTKYPHSDAAIALEEAEKKFRRQMTEK